MIDFLHTSPLAMLFWLMVGHFLADFPLQGDFLAKAKNKYTEPESPFWRVAMCAHATIHAGFIALITGSYLCALLEWSCHITIDNLKCRGRIGFNEDQIYHFLCKIAWVVYIYWAFPALFPGVKPL